MSSYPLSIITPDGQIFSDSVNFCSAPGQEGSLGVLAHHAAMVASLKEGVVKITMNGEEKYFSIGIGILEVDHDGTVLLLVDNATEIDKMNSVASAIKNS